MSQDQSPLLPSLPNEAPGDLLPPMESSGTASEQEIRIISRSQLFYYWPLWFFSLVFALVTKINGQEYTISNVSKGTANKIWMVSSPGLGLSFMIILLIVILFTSVNIRGVWAALVAAVFVILGLLFSLMGWWRPMLKAIGSIQFYLNMHFYLWTGVILFAMWALVIFIFDQRRCIILRPTQITIVEEVGEGEKTYDTMGLVFDKQRDNFFQHWLLGFGSGDLKITTTSGGSRHEVNFPNVLFVTRTIKRTHEILKFRGR